MNNANRLVGRDVQITNIVLVEAIRQMKENDTPETKNIVIDETVMKAKFLMPVRVGEENKLEINMITNDKKENFISSYGSNLGSSITYSLRIRFFINSSFC